MGTLAPTALIPNQTAQPWLTVWNTGSGEIAIAAREQLVGALKVRSFYVADDDPIQAIFTWGQKVVGITNQPGQKVRSIPYALSDEPLASLEEVDLYSSPALLVAGTTPGNSVSTITPNAGEAFTHVDLAWTGAQVDGAQEEVCSASYGQGLNAVVCYPPLGTSRQVVRIDGPVTLQISNGSVASHCDWQVFGVANVVR